MNKKLFIIITVFGMTFAGSAAAMNKKKEEEMPITPEGRREGRCPGAPLIDRRKPLDFRDPKVQAVRRRLFGENGDGQE